MNNIRNFQKVDGNKGNRSELQQGLDEMRNNLQDLLEYQRIRSQLNKAYYDGLKKEGFSEEEALEIVKSDQHS